jgi:hypothetical protein
MIISLLLISEKKKKFELKIITKRKINSNCVYENAITFKLIQQSVLVQELPHL